MPAVSNTGDAPASPSCTQAIYHQSDGRRRGDVHPWLRIHARFCKMGGHPTKVGFVSADGRRRAWEVLLPQGGRAEALAEVLSQ